MKYIDTFYNLRLFRSLCHIVENVSLNSTRRFFYALHFSARRKNLLKNARWTNFTHHWTDLKTFSFFNKHDILWTKKTCSNSCLLFIFSTLATVSMRLYGARTSVVPSWSVDTSTTTCAMSVTNVLSNVLTARKNLFTKHYR